MNFFYSNCRRIPKVWLKSARKGGRSLCRWDVFYRAQLYGVAGTALHAAAYDLFNGLKYHLDAAIQNFAPTIMHDRQRPYFSHHDAVICDFYDNLWIAKNFAKSKFWILEDFFQKLIRTRRSVFSKYLLEIAVHQLFSDGMIHTIVPQMTHYIGSI